VLVVDAMKFSRTAPVRIGHLEQIDLLVTDLPPPPHIAEICAAHGVRVVIAAQQRPVS
jgi:DeoR family glycerol-3-phosphate regulon repressor